MGKGGGGGGVLGSTTRRDVGIGKDRLRQGGDAPLGTKSALREGAKSGASCLLAPVFGRFNLLALMALVLFSIAAMLGLKDALLAHRIATCVALLLSQCRAVLGARRSSGSCGRRCIGYSRVDFLVLLSTSVRARELVPLVIRNPFVSAASRFPHRIPQLEALERLESERAAGLCNSLAARAFCSGGYPAAEPPMFNSQNVAVMHVRWIARRLYWADYPFACVSLVVFERAECTLWVCLPTVTQQASVLLRMFDVIRVDNYMH